MVARLMQAWITWLLLLVAMAAPAAASRASYASKISNLVDPAKLVTLGERGANPRVQKYVALLVEGEAAGQKTDKIAAKALKMAGVEGEAAKLTAKQMVRNLKIAERCGCTDEDGLGRMRKGEAAKVKRGRYKGDDLSVDHIIPRQVVPELDNVIANLELMPLRANKRKNSSMGKRQVELARQLHNAGLLSAQGLRAIEGKQN